MIRLTCLMLFICKISAKRIVVSTSLGDVRGKLICDETTGVSYYAYYGIPYAEPPVGELRFQPPVSKRPWKDVYDATEVGPVCPQREQYYTRDQMDEDCLNFNVYVPANITNKLLPVLCYIHGGYYDTLSGNPEPVFGTELLVQNKVIVTFNYRLGALGFLSLCNEEVSGNAGLKDNILAMKTFHKNIKYFGGDPNKISLLGGGAGGAMVELLMLTNETKGLFSAAWAQSGSVLSTAYLQLYPRQNAMSLAREMGIQYCDDADLIKQLKCADPFDMVEATEAIIKKDPQRGYRRASPFAPTVETENKCAVLTKWPLDLMKQGAIHDIPMAVSVNNQEGAFILATLRDDPNLIDKFNENFGRLITEDIQYPTGSEARKKLAARIKHFYFNDKNISIATCQNYVNYITDTLYLLASNNVVQYFAETKTSPVYFHICGVDTELNYFKAYENITYPGCVHFDDIGYKFVTDATRSRLQNLSPVAERLLDLSFDGITSYTTSGVPTVNPAVWPPAGPDRYHIVVYNYATVTVYHPPYPERIAFWRSVYEEYFNSEYSVGYFCTNPNARSVLQV